MSDIPDEIRVYEQDVIKHALDSSRRIRYLKGLVGRIFSREKSLSDRLRGIANELEHLEQETTSWYVSLILIDGKWEAVACFDPDDCSEEQLIEYTEDANLILPIPNPEYLKEFDGF